MTDSMRVILIFGLMTGVMFALTWLFNWIIQNDHYVKLRMSPQLFLTAMTCNFAAYAVLLAYGFHLITLQQYIWGAIAAICAAAVFDTYRRRHKS
ncbi:hypothetical protein [Phyllobacterium sp. P30BS-XVII]|uniref:hypothetical protein n=1 Tax=Phyllobacterium sp. P30BS-XVII TaxID=2587046 RepID=UPI0015FDA790|nr:hypothetical protein [Phyllobacterium sp. P30BS-XVII]MBA8904187.1 hypothetical protein [Phyllobacterium sp. P30BS-XVII]